MHFRSGKSNFKTRIKKQTFTFTSRPFRKTMKLFSLLIIKRKIETLLLSPFVLYGKWKASRQPLPEEYDLICFFTTHGVGGAEKVNADVVTCIPGKKILVLFCKKTAEPATLHLFKHPHVTILDISRFTHRAQSISNFIYRGIYAYHINRQKKKPVVFIGQCNFGYKLLPHLRKDIRKTELIHITEKKFARVTYPFIPLIDRRVMLAKAIRDVHIGYYRSLGIPERLDERISIVPNMVRMPEAAPVARSYRGSLNICYAGRGGYQKRLHLTVAIIRRCLEAGLPVNMHFAGDFKEELPQDILESCEYHGVLRAGKEVEDFLRKMDILLMTPAFEGFPLIIMEAMANGVIPIATGVNAIPEHIVTGKNGFLIDQPDDETHVVEQGFRHIAHVCAHRHLLPEISANSRAYVREHFSTERFTRGYAEVFGFS
jgi:glycosyltransferase involved in cell wall biosynthesis